jgi:hypothetical protein
MRAGDQSGPGPAAGEARQVGEHLALAIRADRMFRQRAEPPSSSR